MKRPPIWLVPTGYGLVTVATLWVMNYQPPLWVIGALVAFAHLEGMIIGRKWGEQDALTRVRELFRHEMRNVKTDG